MMFIAGAVIGMLAGVFVMCLVQLGQSKQYVSIEKDINIDAAIDSALKERSKDFTLPYPMLESGSTEEQNR